MPRFKKNHRELKKFVGKRKNLSVSAPSVPTEQFSTSVLAEQLSAIEVGVKKTTCGIIMLLTIISTGAPAPGAPVVPTPLCIVFPGLKYSVL